MKENGKFSYGKKYKLKKSINGFCQIDSESISKGDKKAFVEIYSLNKCIEFSKKNQKRFVKSIPLGEIYSC